MIYDKRMLAIIPARGGSKGVPRKNIRLVGGKPLIAWTIEAAMNSKYIDRLVLSSDDEEIIDVAKSWGCEVPFVRPKELASDDTPGILPVLHAINHIKGYDYIVLLQPTSPLRSSLDIDRCIEKCYKYDSNTCVSVTESDKSPYWMYKIKEDHKLDPVLPKSNGYRRQDLPKVYALNGAIYVAKIDWIINNQTFLEDNTMSYIMPKERSIDIDTEIDIKLCELYLKEFLLTYE